MPSPHPIRRILILAANPQNTGTLRLDAEVREIQEGLQRSAGRDRFKVIAKWAVRTDDLRRALLEYEPHIVHFAGMVVVKVAWFWMMVRAASGC